MPNLLPARILLLPALALLLASAGCGKPAARESADQPAAAPAPESGAGIRPASPRESQQILEDLQRSRIGDSARFPYVYQLGGRSNWFEAYSMRFRLTYEYPLAPRTNDQVPWVNPENYNENNGMFITYLSEGRQPSLMEPYVQVQYLNRKLPACSVIDSVYWWLDQQLLARPGASAPDPLFQLNTAAGDPAKCKTYQTPSGPDQMKHIAYAYIAYDEQYLIGMALTTMNRYDFEQFKPAFYSLVQSFDRK
jgi:hypothetical protein